MLTGVTLGVSAGDRIGIVGRNGDGKSTLLRLIAGAEEPDAGAVVRAGGLELALLGQGDDLDEARTVRDELVGGRADHEWAADARFRAVLDGLLGGVAMRRFPNGLDTPIARRCPAASGGGSRWPARCSTRPSCCCSTSRPTISTSRASTGWPATSPRAADRCWSSPTTAGSSTPSARYTWEVVDGDVEQYEGGYAAYVLARAERDRQALVARGAPPACWSARSSRGCGAARRRARASRSSGSRRPTR